MSKGRIFCDKCDKWYDFEYESSSDLPIAKCPKCNCNKIWFGDLFIGEDKGPDTVILGRGGKGQRL